MNAMDIITGLNDVQGSFILRAEEFRQGKRNAHRLPKKKLWLIAAIIALALLLVGCAVVYALRLQDLKVGEYRYTAPTAYDENGEAVPVPTHPLQTVLSAQGVNQQAFMEWEAYCREQEQNSTVNETEEAEIPAQYRWPYGCRSWEMVKKLDEIAAKYALKLLSSAVDVQSYEASVLFDALGIGKLFEGSCEYASGSFCPEGTFQLSLTFELDNEQWPYSNYANYRYSKKAYLDPHGTVVSDFENTAQWSYARKDEQTLLLAMNHEQAFLFADCSDAFITVSFASFKWSNGEKAEMPRSVLEQIGELFDFDLQPHPADMAQVLQLQADAQAAYASERAQSKAARYTQGYESYIQDRLDHAASDYNRDSMYYSLYDLNGDGIQELLPGGKLTLWEVLSIRDGESYLYGDLIGMDAFSTFEICENHVLALKDYFSENRYYLRADADGLTFLEGLWKDGNTWYFLPERPVPGPSDTVKKPITDAQAEAIMASYVPLEVQPERQLMKNWGQPVKTIPWTDPYARYIAEMLDRFEDSEKFTYALIDLNGDGIDELLTKDVWAGSDDLGRPDYELAVHTIVDGKLVTPQATSFTGVCENGILMYQNKMGTEYEFFRMTGAEITSIERIWQEPLDLYWTRFVASDPQHKENAFSEETAREYIGAYKPITLVMKPFSEYPFG